MTKVYSIFFILGIFLVTSKASAFGLGSDRVTKPCVRLNDYGEPCLTEIEFEKISKEVIREFKPKFNQSNWDLIDQLDWTSTRENATYNWVNKNTFSLVIFGGAARATEVSREALVFIVCHELGHIYGYVTKEGDQSLNGMEGEADYFAGNVCAPKIIARMQTASNVKLPSKVINDCRQSSYTSPSLCIRSNQGAFAASRFRARILQQKEPSFLTPDLNQVPMTTSDSNAQCGLDTFYAGSLNRMRPRCWYKPANHLSDRQRP